jgi:hypothetical protein
MRKQITLGLLATMATFGSFSYGQAIANSIPVSGSGCSTTISNVQSPAPSSYAYTYIGTCTAVGVNATGGTIPYTGSGDVSDVANGYYYNSIHSILKYSPGVIGRLVY